MRIISGSLGGRNFASPHSHRTHPMSDRVRGALFNTLGDISDLTVLDAFAGSGALGLEAISRGAQRALLIESDRLAQRTITENIQLLGLGNKVQLIQANCSSWSDNNSTQEFDLVLLDPPYDAIRLPLVQKLAQHTRKDGGIMVLSFPGHEAIPSLDSTSVDRSQTFEVVDSKSYGDAQLIFYRRT